MRVVRSNNQPAYATAGQTIKALRELRGWSQADLARYAQKHSKDETIAPKTISNIETAKHKTTLGKLAAVADAFDMEVWQLFLPLPDGMDEAQAEVYFKELKRLVEIFRQLDDDARRSVLRNARLEAEIKLSAAV